MTCKIMLPKCTYFLRVHSLRSLPILSIQFTPETHFVERIIVRYVHSIHSVAFELLNRLLHNSAIRFCLSLEGCLIGSCNHITCARTLINFAYVNIAILLLFAFKRILLIRLKITTKTSTHTVLANQIFKSLSLFLSRKY